MNNVEINADDMPLPAWSGGARAFALKVLDEINRDNWELSIVFCTDKLITELNTQYRGKAEPTDILSFNLGETIKDKETTVYLPGDIFISLDSMRENSRYFQISEDEELRRLIIHGILHLDGMDHKTLDENEPMLSLQEKILETLKDECILSGGNA